MQAFVIVYLLLHIKKGKGGNNVKVFLKKTITIFNYLNFYNYSCIFTYETDA